MRVTNITQIHTHVQIHTHTYRYTHMYGYTHTYVYLPGAHNGVAVRKVGAGIAHAFN